MTKMRELKGSKADIARQIQKEPAQIVSVWIMVEDGALPASLSDEEFAKLMAELEANAVSAPHADDSREAIYTRMPGE